MAKFEMEIIPFEVPVKVYLKTPPRKRQDGFQQVPTVKISDLPREALQELCDEFRRKIFDQTEYEL
jgi:hypothetical protein